MIKFKDLTEAKETVVFGFGRFNPPTTGHEKLIEKVASVAGSNPFFIYPSHTTGPKDPLPHAKKVAWMRKMFPKYKKNIIADRNAKSAIHIAEKLYKDGYKNLIMVAGSDRLKEFDTLLQKYNDAPDKKGNQLFKFDSVKVVSAGERDPDAEGVEGMSASKMRTAAADGKFDSFKTGIPATLNDADKKKLYFEVRKNMGIREDREMGDDYDSLRDAYLTGKIWNVGEVVEAKGNRGEVVRKGTNYLSFVTEDGKVHKAWLHEILVEEITKKDLDEVEKYADKIFAKVGIDVEFTRHFMDRVNDARNKKPITTSELTRLFKQSFKKYGKKIAQLGPDAEAVINDMKTDVNMPFVLNLKGQELELVAKTVMRKKDFKTSGPKLSFEDLVGGKQMSGPTGQIFAMKTEEVELDELSSQIPWLNRVLAKMHQLTHTKGYEQVLKDYILGMKDDKNRKHPSAWAADVAKEYSGVEARDFIKYVNKLVSKGDLPKELKANYEAVSEQNTFADLVKHINEVKQDKDVKDKEGTQPAKYYAGDMAKSTKDKRDAHFNKKKEGPAPGDASAKTKTSTHTKKFKQMFGEVLPDNADQGDYIDDFAKSDAPQFKGKSKEKRKEMAIAAYLSKNESTLDEVMETLNESGHTDVASMKNKVQIAMSALQKMEGELSKLGDEDDLPTWWTNKVATAVSRLDDMSDYLDTQVEESELDERNYAKEYANYQGTPEQIARRSSRNKARRAMGDKAVKGMDVGHADNDPMNNDPKNLRNEDPSDNRREPRLREKEELDEKIEGLVNKAKKSGMPYSILKKVYDRGMAAWKTGHRPGTTPQQWAFARVNSFTTKSAGTWGKADSDLAKQVEQIEEACWDGYKQVGMKKKGDKEVPNCVPEETDLNEWGEMTEKDDKSGKELNNPTKGDIKKYKVYVRNDKGNVVKVEFGDPNMEIKRDDPQNRANFRARHNCDQKKDKTTAGYWSCKFWSSKSVTDLMKG